MLVVEDEAALADAVARGLRREGMAVDVAYDGGGRAREGHGHPLRRGRARPRPARHVTATSSAGSWRAEGALTRVLMLTASGTVADRVEGLSLGADDYLAKPFAFAELVARVRALGRRSTPPAPPVLVAGDLVLDAARRTVDPGRPAARADPQGVRRAGGAAGGRAARVVSSEELLDRVWDENADPFTTTVRVTMMTLRRKLGEPGAGRDRRRRRLPGAGRGRRRGGGGIGGDGDPPAGAYAAAAAHPALRRAAASVRGDAARGVAARRAGPRRPALPRFPPGAPVRLGDGRR